MLISNYVKDYLIRLNRKHIAWGNLTELDEIFDAFYKRERLIDVHPKNRHKRILDRLDHENYKNGIQKENAIFTKKLSQIGEDGKLARMFVLKETEEKIKKCRFCDRELKHNGWACNQSPCEVCDEYCCSCFCSECGLQPCQCDYIEYYTKEIIIYKGNFEKEVHTLKNIKKFKDAILRHEIIHGFFHESGLSNYEKDEVLVDFLALQTPKLIKIFKELKIDK